MSFGGGGGSKGAAKQAPIPPVVAPAAPNYAEDTAAMEAEKSKAQKALLAMKGRQSTILTMDNQSNAADAGKRQLLGAA
jgi:hypothetical protein